MKCNERRKSRSKNVMKSEKVAQKSVIEILSLSDEYGGIIV